MPARTVADARAAIVAAIAAQATAGGYTTWAVRSGPVRVGDGQQPPVAIELQLGATDDPHWVVFTVRCIAAADTYPETAEANLDLALDVVDGAMPTDVMWGGWSPSRYEPDDQVWVIEGTVRASRDWPPA